MCSALGQCSTSPGWCSREVRYQVIPAFQNCFGSKSKNATSTEEKDGGSKDHFPEPQVLPFLPDTAQEKNDSKEKSGHHITGADIARVLCLDKSRIGIFFQEGTLLLGVYPVFGEHEGGAVWYCSLGASWRLGDPGFECRFKLRSEPARNNSGADRIIPACCICPGQIDVEIDEKFRVPLVKGADRFGLSSVASWYFAFWTLLQMWAWYAQNQIRMSS